MIVFPFNLRHSGAPGGPELTWRRNVAARETIESQMSCAQAGLGAPGKGRPVARSPGRPRPPGRPATQSPSRPAEHTHTMITINIIEGVLMNLFGRRPRDSRAVFWRS